MRCSPPAYSGPNEQFTMTGDINNIYKNKWVYAVYCSSSSTSVWSASSLAIYSASLQRCRHPQHIYKHPVANVHICVDSGHLPGMVLSQFFITFVLLSRILIIVLKISKIKSSHCIKCNCSITFYKYCNQKSYIS